MSIVFVLMLVALGFLFILVPLVVGTVILVIVSHRQKKAPAPVTSAAEATEPTEPQSLAQVLKGHRLRCNMTQDFVAEQLDVSRQAVSKWENGTSEPSTGNLLSLARLYGVDAGELLKNANPNG